MMISRAQVQSLLQVYGKQDTKKSVGNKSSVSRGFDQMLVSEQAKAFQVAKQAISNTPDVREEKVAALQQAVQLGTYQVSNREIAEKMLSRSIIDTMVM